jgi:ribosome-associated protein
MAANMIEIKLEGEEFILLQALLKASDLCDTGGEAKIAITEGKVKVDGQTELRRGKKIRAGQIVSFAGKKVQVIN